MAIHVSASALNDYISCHNKVYYRIFKKEAEIKSKESIMGTIAHKIIETKWNDITESMKFLNYLCNKEGLSGQDKNALETYIHIYFENFRQHLSDDDLIEYRFKVNLWDDVYLVGVLDRVSNGSVYDWKTGRNVPKSLENNVQFIIYNLAYNMVFGKPSSGLYFASLREGKLIRYYESKHHTNTLIGSIIPEYVQSIRKESFGKTGLFNGACYRCPFKSDCLGENNELDNTEFIER